MPVFMKDGRSILFVHVPKTGGTSIEQLFLTAGWQRRYFLSKKSNELDNHHYGLLRCPPQHMEADQLRMMFRLDQFDAIFMLARNPISRFRSEYAMRKLSGPQPKSDQKSVDEWADRQFKMMAENPYILDNHLRPQVDFFLPGAHVYRLEDGLDSVAANLNEYYDIQLPETVDHAMDSRKLSAGMSSSSVEISESLEARLRAVYREDFSAFQY